MNLLTPSKKKPLSYLSDFAKARGVNRSVLGGDGDCVPALVRGRAPPAWGVLAPATPSAHPASGPAARLLLGDEGLLHLHVLPVLLQLGVFVDLVNGLGTLVASPGHPVVLGRGWRERT